MAADQNAVTHPANTKRLAKPEAKNSILGVYERH